MHQELKNQKCHEIDRIEKKGDTESDNNLSLRFLYRRPSTNDEFYN